MDGAHASSSTPDEGQRRDDDLAGRDDGDRLEAGEPAAGHEERAVRQSAEEQHEDEGEDVGDAARPLGHEADPQDLVGERREPGDERDDEREPGARAWLA